MVQLLLFLIVIGATLFLFSTLFHGPALPHSQLPDAPPASPPGQGPGDQRRGQVQI